MNCLYILRQRDINNIFDDIKRGIVRIGRYNYEVLSGVSNDQ